MEEESCFFVERSEYLLHLSWKYLYRTVAHSEREFYYFTSVFIFCSTERWESIFFFVRCCIVIWSFCNISSNSGFSRSFYSWYHDGNNFYGSFGIDADETLIVHSYVSHVIPCHGKRSLIIADCLPPLFMLAESLFLSLWEMLYSAL